MGYNIAVWYKGMKMRRCAGFGPLAMLGLMLAVQTAAGQPNIVWIMADDLGYGDVGCFYEKSAIRTPTRASVMTGQYPSGNCEKGGAPSNGIIQDVKFLPQFLKKAGYKTGGFGKWHMGHGEGDHPIDRGFDRWIGF